MNTHHPRKTWVWKERGSYSVNITVDDTYRIKQRNATPPVRVPRYDFVLFT